MNLHVILVQGPCLCIVPMLVYVLSKRAHTGNFHVHELSCLYQKEKDACKSLGTLVVEKAPTQIPRTNFVLINPELTWIHPPPPTTAVSFI